MVVLCVIFTNSHEAVARGVVLVVGESHLGFGSDWLRCVAGLDLPNLLVSVIREEDRSVVHRERASAVFVDGRAGTERRREDIFDGAVGRAANDDIAPLFFRAAFDPVNGVAIGRNVAEAHGPLHEHLGRDWGSPGTVRGDGRLRLR